MVVCNGERVMETCSRWFHVLYTRQQAMHIFLAPVWRCLVYSQPVTKNIASLGGFSSSPPFQEYTCTAIMFVLVLMVWSWLSVALQISTRCEFQSMDPQRPLNMRAQLPHRLVDPIGAELLHFLNKLNHNQLSCVQKQWPCVHISFGLAMHAASHARSASTCATVLAWWLQTSMCVMREEFAS